MKYHLLYIVLLKVLVYSGAQTTLEDLEFILSQDFQLENYRDYDVRNGGHWGYKEGGILRDTKFMEIYRDSVDKRGVVLMYKEMEGSDLKKHQTYFIPQKGSDQEIWKKSFELLKEVPKDGQFRALLWAVMKYCSNNKLMGEQ